MWLQSFLLHCFIITFPTDRLITFLPTYKLNIQLINNSFSEVSFLGTLHTYSIEFDDFFSEWNNIEYIVEGLSLESCVQGSHNNNQAFIGKLLSHFSQIGKELSLINPHNIDILHINIAKHLSQLSRTNCTVSLPIYINTKPVMGADLIWSSISFLLFIAHSYAYLLGMSIAAKSANKLGCLPREHWPKHHFYGSELIHAISS